MVDSRRWVTPPSSLENKSVSEFRGLSSKYSRRILLAVVTALKLDNAELRAVTLTSLISGFVFTSRIVPLQGLSTATESQRKALLGKLIQQILTAKI